MAKGAGTIDYAAGAPRLQGGLSASTMKALGEASKAEAGVGQYASTGLDKALDTVKNTAVNVVKAETDRKNELFKEFNNANKDVSAMAGSLGKGYYDSYKTEIDGLRGDLVAARTEEQRADVYRRLNELKVETEAVKAGKNSIANTDPEVFSKNMPEENLHTLTEFQKENFERIVQPDGSVKYKINNKDGSFGMHTLDEITEMQEVVDVDFREDIKKRALNAYTAGGDDNFFDQEAMEGEVKAGITEENVGSLINDPMFGGTSFKEDMLKRFDDTTYQQFAMEFAPDVEIKKEEGEKFWYQNISEDDKLMILNMFTDPNDDNYDFEQTKNALSGYFSNHIMINNQKGIKERERKMVSVPTEKGESSAIQQIAKSEKLKKLGYNPSGDVDSYMKIFEGE
tara:strand:+ start:1064 stop:2257 length:1194 start_codon:yes stop_codon:yes gene_type:complete